MEMRSQLSLGQISFPGSSFHFERKANCMQNTPQSVTESVSAYCVKNVAKSLLPENLPGSFAPGFAIMQSLSITQLRVSMYFLKTSNITKHISSFHSFWQLFITSFSFREHSLTFVIVLSFILFLSIKDIFKVVFVILDLRLVIVIPFHFNGVSISVSFFSRR